MTNRDLKGERVVVWPAFFDRSRSRKYGRKLPLNLCVKKPKIEEIVKAAERAGLDPIVLDKKYPRTWWEDEKCVAVLKKGGKMKTLRIIAEELRRMRGKYH